MGFDGGLEQGDGEVAEVVDVDLQGGFGQPAIRVGDGEGF